MSTMILSSLACSGLWPEKEEGLIKFFSCGRSCGLRTQAPLSLLVVLSHVDDTRITHVFPTKLQQARPEAQVGPHLSQRTNQTHFQETSSNYRRLN